MATTGHRFLGNIRLRQSRSGDNADKTVPLFVTPYYAAGNGCNCTGAAGSTLRRGQLCQCEKSGSRTRGMSYFRFHVVFLSRNRREFFSNPWSRASNLSQAGNCQISKSGTWCRPVSRFLEVALTRPDSSDGALRFPSDLGAFHSGIEHCPQFHRHPRGSRGGRLVADQSFPLRL